MRAAPLALRVSAAIAGVASLAPYTAVAGDVLPVTSCADDGSPGTLRSVAAQAAPDTTIDLSGLTCSTITLEQGAIQPAGGVFTLRGPGMDRLMIDGNGLDRVLKGTKVTIEGLTLAHGRISGDGASGGCVEALTGVVLRGSRVTGCSVDGGQGAGGGGLSARDYAAIYDSVVSDNIVSASSFLAWGGGIVSDRITVDHSWIIGNGATGVGSRGGGIYAGGVADILYSTIDDNSADYGGGGFCGWTPNGICLVSNSTISGNTAYRSGGGWLVADNNVYVGNSTIAFNVAEAGVVGGVLVRGNFYGGVVQSSIIADNTAGDRSLSVDLDTDEAIPPEIIGNSNLLTEVGRLDPGHIIADPRLAPLAAYGGPTPTHALAPDSPAIDGGTNFSALDTDQRGRSRVSGAAADIGAYELQTDMIFANGFD